MEFYEDKLLIFDRAKRERRSYLFLAAFGLFLGVSFILSGWRHHDVRLYTGIALIFLWIIVLIVRRKALQKVYNDLSLKDIDKVTFSTDKIQGNPIAMVKMKNKGQRKIRLSKKDNQDVEFKDLLIEHNIKAY